MKLCDDAHITVPMGDYCVECDNHLLLLELSGEVGVSNDGTPVSVDLPNNVEMVKERA